MTGTTLCGLLVFSSSPPPPAPFSSGRSFCHTFLQQKCTKIKDIIEKIGRGKIFFYVRESLTPVILTDPTLDCNFLKKQRA